MAGLAPVVESLDKVPEAARTFYEQKDGKYHLSLDGSPVGFVPITQLNEANVKVVEFRDKNIALMKENDDLKPKVKAFEGLDPTTVRTSLTELEEFRKKGGNKPDEIDTKIQAAIKAVADPLRQEVDTLKKEKEEATTRADQSTLRSTVQDFFTKAGGEPSALDYIVGKAGDVFIVKAGSVTAKENKFSAERPGEPLSVTEWLATQVKESAFAFKSSNGGGASGGAPGGGSGDGLKPGQTWLTDPTMEQLGDNAKLIREGKVKVRYTNQ